MFQIGVAKRWLEQRRPLFAQMSNKDVIQIKDTEVEGRAKAAPASCTSEPDKDDKYYIDVGARVGHKIRSLLEGSAPRNRDISSRFQHNPNGLVSQRMIWKPNDTGVGCDGCRIR